jgi:hypothetical protein
MALPAGVSTCTLTAGPITDATGALLSLTLTVTPVYGSAPSIVWGATGAQLTNDVITAAGDVGTQVSVTVPHVNQSGFLDQSQAAYSGWAYTCVLKTNSGREKTLWTKSVQPLVGQSVVDLDTVATGSATAPVSAPYPDVISVNGQTGIVVIDTGGGSGTGSVDSVNGVGPDVDGNVLLNIGNIPDVTTVGQNLAKAGTQGAGRQALGLGGAATHPVSDFDPAGAAAAVQAGLGTAATHAATDFVGSSDASVTNPRIGLVPAWVSGHAYILNELTTNAGTLYITTTAHTSSGVFDATKFTAVQGAAQTGVLLSANNLSDLQSASTSRNNLGLGSAATQPISAFDPAGSAALALSAAIDGGTL